MGNAEIGGGMDGISSVQQLQVKGENALGATEDEIQR
jgi:hypothetical protein